MLLRLFDSLRARLLAVSSLVMLLFTAVAVGVLDNAFERSARDSVREQLNAQLYALLTAAELSNDGELYFPERLAEPRFSVAGSGLYAFVYDAGLNAVWHSQSALSIPPPPTTTLAVGNSRFTLERHADTQLFMLRFAVAWEAGDGREVFNFVIAEDLTRYQAQVDAFRRNLFLWSALGIAVLLLVQLAILQWALRPLGAVERELRRVETGAQRLITGRYPAEISGLTRNINRLMEGSQRSLERYRNSLGDLAHSLKTPLAVLRGLSGEQLEPSALRSALEEQTRRMGNIVDHQLKRAASSGGDSARGWSNLEEIAGRVLRTLEKVYADRAIDFRLEIDAGLRIAMDEADLMEVLGNVLENACKWCRGLVGISAVQREGRVEIHVVDDGPGIDPALARDVLQRGVRADQRVPGHGIGLAVVRDIVAGYHGKVRIARSVSGGADVVLTIPSLPLEP